MDHIFIKEEVEDTYDAGSVSTVSESYSNRSSNTSLSPSLSAQTSSTNSFPPTQRVQPSTLAPSRGLVAGGFPHYLPSVTEESSINSNPPGLKRKGPETTNSNIKHPRSRLSLMSPPLLPTGPSFHLPSPHKSNTALVPGYPQAGPGSSITQDGGVSQEDEWKNIKVVRVLVFFLSNLKIFSSADAELYFWDG